MRYLWGIIAIIIGFLVVKYAFQIVNMFGKNNWAEEHMSSLGGTYMLYKLVGVGIIILAMLYMFNAVGFLISPLTPLFGGLK